MTGSWRVRAIGLAAWVCAACALLPAQGLARQAPRDLKQAAAVGSQSSRPTATATSKRRLLAASHDPTGSTALIRQVMLKVESRTTVPVWAPDLTGLPAATVGQLPAAAFSVSTDRYEVHLGPCADLQPPYEHVGTFRCDGSIAALTAGFAFGGRIYASPSASVAAVKRLLAAPPGMGAEPSPASHSRRVQLGHGVTGDERLEGQGFVTWKERGWELQENLAACAPTPATTTALSLARADVAWLSSHALARTAFGAMVAGGSCGDPSSGASSLSWTVGRIVYSVSESGYDPQSAMEIAMRMRPLTPSPSPALANFSLPGAPAAVVMRSANGALATGRDCPMPLPYCKGASQRTSLSGALHG